MHSLAFISLFVLALCKASWSLTCSNYDSHKGATFDITDLYRSPEQPAYQVEDGDIPCTTNIVEKNYTYVFNVCGAVSGSIPPSCKFVDNINIASAIQINRQGTVSTDDDWCFVTGTYTSTTTKVALLNTEDPTKGISVTYYGNPCSNHKQRQFNINLECADKLSAVPTHALELEACVYSITMPSVYGCPLECPVANRHLCGGNGHCAYDTDKLSARCFCNKGFTGADCTKTDSTSTSLNYSPALLGLIITLFIIVVLLAGSIIFMVRQMDAYKEDLANYQSLKGCEEDSAVV